ncbi:MAG: Na/Pi symporter, partial [Bacilli bacterium]
TGLIQSSSATTVIAIGLIRAGLMTLPQAAGIIMGANIGTTVTAFIIGLNISSIAPFILAIGVLIYLFASSPRLKHTGEVFFGWSIILWFIAFRNCAKTIGSTSRIHSIC